MSPSTSLLLTGSALRKSLVGEKTEAQTSEPCWSNSFCIAPGYLRLGNGSHTMTSHFSAPLSSEPLGSSDDPCRVKGAVSLLPAFPGLQGSWM